MASDDRHWLVSLLVRVVPFVAAVAATAATYWGVRDVWTRAPDVAPHVGITAETMRLLVLALLPLSPTVWMIVAMLYLGLQVNSDVLSAQG